jgi:hypothetical protein
MHGRLARAALVMLLFLLVPAALASASDDFGSPRPLYLGTEDATVDNSAGTVQPGETFTASGARCEVSPTEYSEASRTMWWWVTGTGRPLTVTTAGSSFDTHLGIFEGAIDAGTRCQDAAGAETLTFPSVAGQPYRIQVGSCAMSTPNGCQGAASGVIHVKATSPPPANDQRAAATPLASGQTLNGDNYASGEEGGEIVSCALLPYGRTVWYRFTAPAVGGVRFTVNGANPAVAVFNGTGERLGCDATPGGDARVSLPKVPRGDLWVQVGGVGAHAGLVGDAIQSPFTIQAAFSPSNDNDGDGVTNARDCRPDDASVRPGAKDIPRNGVDEDCSGRDAAYPRIRSRASLGVKLHGSYAKVTRLLARSVPAGARVQLRCSGRSCPFARTPALTVPRAMRSVSLMNAKLRKVRIRPVTSFEVRVTQSGRIGRVVRYRFARRGRRPAEQTLCLAPGATKPARCTTVT